MEDARRACQQWQADTLRQATLCEALQKVKVWSEKATVF